MQSLTKTLEAYRRELTGAGETQAAMYAQGGLMLLEHEPDPAENQFLVAICFASLRDMFITAVQQVAEEDRRAAPQQ